MSQKMKVYLIGSLLMQSPYANDIAQGLLGMGDTS